MSENVRVYNYNHLQLLEAIEKKIEESENEIISGEGDKNELVARANCLTEVHKVLQFVHLNSFVDVRLTPEKIAKQFLE